MAVGNRLLDAADIREYERIDVYNLKTASASTYAIRAEAGSGIVRSTARLRIGRSGRCRDPVAYAEFEERTPPTSAPGLCRQTQPRDPHQPRHPHPGRLIPSLPFSAAPAARALVCLIFRLLR